MGLCNECGNPLQMGQRLCDACSAPAVVGAVESQSLPWILDPTSGVSFKACPFCGTKQKPGDRFCEECGRAQPSSSTDPGIPEEERLRSQIEAGHLRSEQQRIKAEEQARQLEEERLRRETEARQRAEEQARVLAEKERAHREAEARQRAAEQARQLEEERLRRESEARQRAEEQARVLAEKERAHREAEARQRSEEEARALVDAETRRAPKESRPLAALEAGPARPGERLVKRLVKKPRPTKSDNVAEVSQDKSTQESSLKTEAAFALLETAPPGSIATANEPIECEVTEMLPEAQPAGVDAGAATERDEVGQATQGAAWEFTLPGEKSKAHSSWMIAGAGVVVLGIALAILLLATGERQAVGPTPPRRPSLPVAPAGMVYIRGGEFLMGDDAGKDPYAKPAHKVNVDSVFMDTYEVTCEEYQKFIKATGHKAPPQWKDGVYPSGAGRKPVTGVDWNDASGYAQWAKKRLPTEEEWEFAARGNTGWRYPWGNEWKSGAANANAASKGLADVGSYQATSLGLFDMVGNAWEWTASSIHSYPGGAIKEDQLPQAQREKAKVIRGGCYLTDAQEATATYRRGWPPTEGSYDFDQTGFRCALDVPK